MEGEFVLLLGLIHQPTLEIFSADALDSIT